MEVFKQESSDSSRLAGHDGGSGVGVGVVTQQILPLFGRHKGGRPLPTG